MREKAIEAGKGKTAALVAEQYLALNRAITEAKTAEERIAARNALIDSTAGRLLYRSPFEM